MSAAAGAAAAAAAAAALQQEEEEMTVYTSDDLDDWEFKIVRSSTGAFKNREKLNAILEEESEAGWQLVEKFDHARVRLKRRTSCRENDHMLTFDAYRTQAGMSDGQVAGIVLGVVVALGVVGALIAVVAAQ